MHTTPLSTFAPKLYTTVDTVKENRVEMVVYLDSFVETRVTIKRPTDDKLADKWEQAARSDQPRMQRKVRVSAVGNHICLEQIELVPGLWLDANAA